MNDSIELCATEFRRNLQNLLVNTAKQIARDKKAADAIATSQAVQVTLKKERSELVTALLRAMSDAGLGGEMRQILLQKVRVSLGKTSRDCSRSTAIAFAIVGLLAGIMLNAPVDALCKYQPRICSHLRLSSWLEDR